MLKPLGEGGLGVVYEAYDRTRDARVALKILRRASPASITRLKREFRALEDLQHPNLVTLHELFEDEGEWFFTMELVEGIDFLEYVRGAGADNDQGGAGKLNEGRLRQGLAQLTGALMALHGVGKVHRDVKPSNVLVAADGRVVLLDFGLVADLDTESDLTSMDAVGTAQYMAPEQAAGRAVGPEADWYAVGSMIYESLTGQPPFIGSSLNVLMDKQRRLPVPPEEVCADVPPDLGALCMELIRTDPTRRPAGHAVLERLREPGLGPDSVVLSLPPEGQTSTTTLSRSMSPFLGRERELALLDQALDDVRRGQQVSVYLQGESGIGKSELLGAFAARCAQANTIHLQGRCYEREDVAYRAVDGLMEDLARLMRRMPKNEAARFIPRRAALLTRVFPALTRVSVLATSRGYDVVDPQELRSQLFEAFRELFQRISEHHTVVLTIDDMQWSDSESLALLAELLRKPGAPPILFLASWRSVHAGENGGVALEALPPASRTLELGRLSHDHALALARDLLAVAGGNLGHAEQVAAAAGGHPILLNELARYTSLSRSQPAEGLSVEEALWSRIARLDEVLRTVLAIFAVSSAPLPSAVVASAAQLGTSELARHVAALRVMRLVRTSATRTNQTAELYHDSIRRAVLAHLDPLAQRALHARLARALSAVNRQEWELLAYHHHGAGEHEAAATYLMRGAEQAEHALAFGHAAKLYARVLDLWTDNHRDRRTVQVRRGEALSNAGRAHEAAQAYSDAVAGADAELESELTRRVAQQLLLAGHVEQGRACLDKVLAAESITLPRTFTGALWSIICRRSWLRLRGFQFQRRDQSRVPGSLRKRAEVCFRAGMAMAITDNVRGQVLVLRGLLEALRIGDPYLVSRAISLHAIQIAFEGSPAEKSVNRMLAYANALAAEADSPHGLALVQVALGQARHLCGHFRAAVQHLTAAERLLRERCVAVHFELDTTMLWCTRALLFLGEYGDVIDRLPGMLEECRQREDLYGEVSLRSSALAYCQLAMDQAELAVADVAETEQRWTHSGYHVQHYYLDVSKASIALYQGRTEDATAIARKATRDVQRSVMRRIQAVRVTLSALQGRSLLAGATGGPTAAAALREVDGLAQRLEREGVAWAKAQAQLLRAGAAHRRGRQDEAVTALRAARSGLEGVEMRVLTACASIRLGRLIEGEEGAALVEQGMASFGVQRIAAPERMLALFAPGFDR